MGLRRSVFISWMGGQENGERRTINGRTGLGVSESMTPNCRVGGAGVRLAWLGYQRSQLVVLDVAIL